jgi:lipid-binding SYLF domain-containing protein
MRRILMLCLTLIGLASCSGTPSQGEEQALVDRSTLTVQEMLGSGNDAMNAASLLRRARGVVVCPQIFRAGLFFAGGEGGGCVLLGRDAAGGWSSPAFYTLGSASFGLVMGVQDAQVIMLIMNDRALNALLDSQFKFGAGAALTVATIGGGVQGSITSAVGADIVAFSRSRGLYGGITLDGSLLTSRGEWNRGYYGREVSGRDIVRAMSVHNPGADPLRAVLMRYGTAGAAPSAAYAPQQPGYAPQPAYGAPPASGYSPPPGIATPPARNRVESAPLPPLR